jgi:hypothetical protein
MEMSPASRRIWPTFAVVAVLLLVALLTAGRVVYFSTPILEQGDTAVNALQISNAKYGAEIYGNYSRFHFNHPGPIFFYVYAGAEWVLFDWLGVVPAPHNAHLIASLALQVGFFSLGLALLSAWIGRQTFLPIALLLSLWHLSNCAGSFLSIWPPHVLLMPFFCFSVAAASFAAGRTQDLVLMAVAGGFLFHGHVAQPLFVGGLGALSLGLHLRGWKKSSPTAVWTDWYRQHRRIALTTGSIAVVLLLPLAIDVLRYGGESNVATIVRRFISNAQEGKTVLQSALYFLSFTTTVTNQEEYFTRLTPESYRFFADHAVAVVGTLLLTGGLAALVWRFRARLPAALAQLLGRAYLLWGVTAVLCVAWGLVQSGPMFQFNGFFYYGVYLYLFLLGLGGLLALLPEFPTPTWRVALFCLAAIVATARYYQPPWSPSEAGEDIREGVRRSLGTAPVTQPKILVFEHDLWPVAAAVALELERRGVQVYAAPAWNFMLGRRHDLTQLGPKPEKSADLWWISRPGDPRVDGARAGITIAKDVAIFTAPPAIDPRGDHIEFAYRGNAFRHVVSGLSVGNVDFAWTEEQRVAFVFDAVPADGDVQVIFDAELHRRTNGPDSQTAEVRVNGELVGRATVRERAQVSVLVPQRVWNARTRGTLELTFPDAVKVDLFVRPAHKLRVAWALRNVWFAAPLAPASTTANGAPLFSLEPNRPAAARYFAQALPSENGRIDFIKRLPFPHFVTVGFAPAEAELTKVKGQRGSILFRPGPTKKDIELEIVALPFAERGKPGVQRCQLYFNGRLMFDSPFTEPGVIRVMVPREIWNEQPVAIIRLDLPDAKTEAGQSAGLALRWLSVRHSEHSRP